jgi:prepilin-type N-terminal cleavage/methylation domain-containing protein
MNIDRKNVNSNRYKNGFTLLEILIVFSLFSVLIGVSAYLFSVSLRAWATGSLRTEVREDMSYAMERTVRDLKEIAYGSLGQYSSIAHTIQFDETGGDTYVLYLYNSADLVFNSTYNMGVYNLHKANITQGDDPDSGEGVLILRDLVSPDAASPATALTISSNQVTLDFVVQRTDEMVRLRTKVRPRNL